MACAGRIENPHVIRIATAVATAGKREAVVVFIGCCCWVRAGVCRPAPYQVNHNYRDYPTSYRVKSYTPILGGASARGPVPVPYRLVCNVYRTNFHSNKSELKRYQRKGLGYSKDLEMHKAAVALHFGIYNFVRIHKTLGRTPAVAAGVEYERWSLERAVEMTAEYLRQKENAKFEQAFAKLE